MENSPNGKQDKCKRVKKRKTRDGVATSVANKPLVEYSDVSSEDLSEPEAGEIQSGEEAGAILSNTEDGEVAEFGDYPEDLYAPAEVMHRDRRSYLLEEMYIRNAAMVMRSPSKFVYLLIITEIIK